MNPWLRQLGRVILTEVLPKKEGGAQGSTSSHGTARRGQPTPPEVLQRGKEASTKDSEDARVAELRKRYKKVQNEPDGVTRLKSATDSNWF